MAMAQVATRYGSLARALLRTDDPMTRVASDGQGFGGAASPSTPPTVVSRPCCLDAHRIGTHRRCHHLLCDDADDLASFQIVRTRDTHWYGRVYTVETWVRRGNG